MASEPKVGDIKKHEQVYVGEGHWVSCAWPSIARRLSAELSAAREMREVLREIEWSGFSQYSSGRWVDPVSGRVFDDPPQNLRACPRCYGLQPEQPFLPPPGIFRIGHAPDCRLARLIGGGR